jgi:TonB family protein
LLKPSYNSEDQGKVVVTITVNKEGKVIKAIAGAKGTSVSDQTLWKMAETAALRSTFNAKSDAAEEQKGTITYRFVKSK